MICARIFFPLYYTHYTYMLSLVVVALLAMWTGCSLLSETVGRGRDAASQRPQLPPALGRIVSVCQISTGMLHTWLLSTGTFCAVLCAFLRWKWARYIVYGWYIEALRTYTLHYTLRLCYALSRSWSKAANNTFFPLFVIWHMWCCCLSFANL
jgi:hypothetical protein